jgi:hypothetical protein
MARATGVSGPNAAASFARTLSDVRIRGEPSFVQIDA